MSTPVFDRWLPGGGPVGGWIWITMVLGKQSAGAPPTMVIVFVPVTFVGMVTCTEKDPDALVVVLANVTCGDVITIAT